MQRGMHRQMPPTNEDSVEMGLRHDPPSMARSATPPGAFSTGFHRVGNEFQPAKSCHLQLHSLIAVLSIGRSVDGRLL
jgi:hypothetical protein